MDCTFKPWNVTVKNCKNPPCIISSMIELIIMANSARHSDFVYLEQYFQGTLVYRFKLQPSHLNAPNLRKCLQWCYKQIRSPLGSYLQWNIKYPPQFTNTKRLSYKWKYHIQLSRMLKSYFTCIINSNIQLFSIKE